MENKSFTQNTNFGFDNPNSQELPPKPDNYLVLSIVATIIGICSPCCIGLIVGVISIVFSTQVDSKYGYKDYIGAEQSSKNAKILAFVAIGLGIIGLILNVITFTAGNGMEMIEEYRKIIEEYSR